MSDLSLRKSKAFDLVHDTVKLLITLATAIIGLTAGKVLTKDSNSAAFINVLRANYFIAILSWWLIALSIFFGIFTILKLTGILGNEKNVSADLVTIYDNSTKFFFMLQLFSFFIGIVCSGILVIKAMVIN